MGNIIQSERVSLDRSISNQFQFNTFRVIGTVVCTWIKTIVYIGILNQNSCLFMGNFLFIIPLNVLFVWVGEGWWCWWCVNTNHLFLPFLNFIKENICIQASIWRRFVRTTGQSKDTDCCFTVLIKSSSWSALFGLGGCFGLSGAGAKFPVQVKKSRFKIHNCQS